jgi:thiol-disulfide isomerase/thioredoxin
LNKKLNNREIDSIVYLNQDLSMLSVYKVLSIAPKDLENFMSFRYILSSPNIGYDNKLHLFESYPVSIQKNNAGIKAKNELNKFRNNVNLLFPENHSLLNTGLKKVTSTELFRTKYENYILIFSASWCSPCRYQEKSLQMLVNENSIDTSKVKIQSIYIDKESTAWLKAIQEDNFGWTSFLTTDSWNSPLLKQLNINSVPRFLYISHDKKILTECEHIADLLKYISAPNKN